MGNSLNCQLSRFRETLSETSFFIKLKFHISDQSGDEDLKALKEIVSDLGGWPLLEGDTWDGSQWTMEKTITSIRKKLGFRSDKIFDIASFIINLENDNNVSCH